MIETFLSVRIGDVDEVRCWDLKTEESERNETTRGRKAEFTVKY